jgi:hypothetical protein
LNIKNKNENTNHVADGLIRPPIVILTTVLNSYSRERDSSKREEKVEGEREGEINIEREILR